MDSGYRCFYIFHDIFPKRGVLGHRRKNERFLREGASLPTLVMGNSACF